MSISNPIEGKLERKVYPDDTTTVEYADYVGNIANTKHVAKLNMMRVDTSADAAGINNASLVVQLIMPLDGFVNMYHFMGKYIEDMIQRNVLTREQVDALTSEPQ